MCESTNVNEELYVMARTMEVPRVLEDNPTPGYRPRTNITDILVNHTWNCFLNPTGPKSYKNLKKTVADVEGVTAQVNV